VKRACLPALALLAGYGILFAMAALGRGPVAFDDHPGQLYRAWHVVLQGFAPWRWDEGWWGGYPELQFYPPGPAYATALLHLASLGRVTVEGAYQTVVWIAYLAPALTAFLVLAALLGDGWRALPGAFVAMTLSAGLASGVDGGVRTGMVAARLGAALLPLLALVLRRFADGSSIDAPPATSGTRMPLAVMPLIATVALTHPAHVPAAAVLVLIVAWLRPAVHARGIRSPRWPRLACSTLAPPLLALTGAAALTGFWSVPLLARLGETRALAWGRLTAGDFGLDLLTRPLLLVLLALAVVAWWLARSPMERVITAWPWAMALVVALDAVVAEPLGVRWLPADRLIDSAWVAVVLAAGVAIGKLVERGSHRPALALAAIAALVVVSVPGHALTLWPRASDWPTLPAVVRGGRLQDLWSALRRAPAGRVLFVRSAVPLVFGTEWYRPHSHVTSLTPLVTGRPIVNGTFTHPSPIAALVYGGSARPAPIRELVERRDGLTLFGRRLDALDRTTFDRYADALGAAVVVAVDDDVPALARLEGSGALTRISTTPPFVVYARPVPIALPTSHGAARWTLRVRGEPGHWVSARVTYYPLWRVTEGIDARPTRRGELGDLQVQIAGRDPVLDLSYGPGAAELGGVGLSALAALVWVGALATRFGRR
jgi:hypothetical protein